MTILEIRNLNVHYRVGSGHVRAVDDVSLRLRRGQCLGIIGESGCGKTTLSASILRLLPPNGHIAGGEIIFDGNKDLVNLPMQEMLKIRWKEISMIFQGAMNALNPVFRVGEIFREVLQVHENATDDEVFQRMTYLLDLVGLPPDIANRYPHELSGGMKQRVVIALSLTCSPKLVIADEPTTALDVVTQDQILMRIKEIRRKLGISMILISHDISIVAETVDLTAVMYAGHLFEQGDTKSIFEDPRNPYTSELFKSFPSIRGKMTRLAGIPGEPPNLLSSHSGCVFSPRCPIATEKCETTDPPRIEISPHHWSVCHYAEAPQLFTTSRN